MRSRRACCIVAILLLPTLWPALALAQQPAGVVTNLQGQATLSRPVLPQPIPVKMKDDLFVQDRIDTRENSIVRVLLGGKAIVTVRELSSFQITEEPGLARVDLRSGKLALGVARSLLKPGEAIEIRTPNAVAAVRGSIGVIRTGVSDGKPYTDVKVLDGDWNVCRGEDYDDPAKRLDPTVCVDLGIGKFLAVSGDVLGQRRDLTDAERAEALGDYSGAPKLTALDGAEEQLRQAAGVAAAVLGDTPVGEFQPPLLPPPPTVGSLCVNCPATTSGATSGGGGGGGVIPTKPPFGTDFGSLVAGLFRGETTTSQCDDCVTRTNVAFGFNFPFRGTNFSGARISSNGFLYLGAADNTFLRNGCCDARVPSFLSLLPVIAPAWFDLDPRHQGGVKFKTLPDKFVLTWDGVPEFGERNSNTFQVQLLSNGQIIFFYKSMSIRDHDALVGISPNGFTTAPPPASTDFTSRIAFSTGTDGTVYELFRCEESTCGTFELSNKSILFTPNGLGGWDVLVDDVDSFLSLTNGKVITFSGRGPFVSLTGTAIKTGGYFLEQAGGSLLTLGGPLVRATDSPLTLEKGLVSIRDGSRLVTSSTDPLVSLIGGTHSIATAQGASMFELVGSGTAVDAETGLTLGTDRPLQYEGVLLETAGATVSGQKAMKVDTALLEATAPLLNLTAGSTFTTSGNAFDLVNQAKVSVSGSGAMVHLDSSIMNVISGHLANVAASRLNVAGDFLRMSGNSTLNILNGLLLNVLNGGIASIGGAFVNFTGTGNVINVTNSLVPTTFVSGVPIFVATGAVANISITGTPIVGLRTAGTININGAALAPGATGGVTGSLIGVQGTGGTVKIGP